MSVFSESVPRSNARFRFLPLFHTCDGISARNYMKRGKIETRDTCEVFGERISYLFYGRASYKYALTDDSTTRLDLYPVCFAFDFDLVSDIKRIYPFDSGAKHHKLLDGFINPKIELADFEIEPDKRRVADIVLRFYGKNSKYLSGETQEIEIDPLDFETRSYIEMTRSFVQEKADERRVTIEVQAGEILPFSGGTLRGVACPIQYLDSPLFQSFRTNNSINVKTYEIAVWNPRMSFGTLAHAAKGLIDPEALND